MIFTGETEENLNTVMHNLSMELVTDPAEILNVLADGKVNGTAVGINSPLLGSEIVVTAVEDIIIDEDFTIVLKYYDTSGYMLETNKLRLADIRSVYAFKSPFENPYMRTIRQSKSL
jgi:hypothetical protein